MMTIKSTTFICQLPSLIQDKISNKIESYLTNDLQLDTEYANECL